MNWSPQQRHLLQALGHDLMAHGRQWPPIRTRAASVAIASPARVADTKAIAPVIATSARLMEALRRAAGGADLAALALDLERMRREPELKRALWPRLRALRRSH